MRNLVDNELEKIELVTETNEFAIMAGE